MLDNATLDDLMTMDLDGLDLDALTALNTALSNHRDAIRERQLAVAERLNAAVAEREARLRLEAMSDPERAALARIIMPQGTESGEAVNGA